MIDDLLAPLKAEPPTDAEIERLLAAADRRTRRRRIRIVTGAALATAAATAALAALPAKGPAPVPATAAAILRSAATTAAEQPGPPAWTGYRYVQEIDRRETAGYTLERTEEEWVDSTWQGRMISTAKLLRGEITPPEPPPGVHVRPGSGAAFVRSMLATRDLSTPADMPNLYGDGPLARVPLSELPTNPGRLADLLLAAHTDGRWTPGGGWDPAPETMHSEVLRDILLLLTLANATPEQRGALITVLTNYDGVTALPSVLDRRGRPGRGVEIAVGREAPVRVIFAPDTSELLQWSQGGETHTFLRFAHVARIGDRP
jgi:hypothetical protein